MKMPSVLRIEHSHITSHIPYNYTNILKNVQYMCTLLINELMIYRQDFNFETEDKTKGRNCIGNEKVF